MLDSVAVRLPRSIVRDVGIDEGDLVDVSVHNGTIVIRSGRPRYSLAALVRRITARNRPREADWTTRVGRERRPRVPVVCLRAATCTSRRPTGTHGARRHECIDGKDHPWRLRTANGLLEDASAAVERSRTSGSSAEFLRDRAERPIGNCRAPYRVSSTIISAPDSTSDEHSANVTM